MFITSSTQIFLVKIETEILNFDSTNSCRTFGIVTYVDLEMDRSYQNKIN